MSDDNFDCEKCKALCIQQGYAIKGKDCPDYPNGKAPRPQDSLGSTGFTGYIALISKLEEYIEFLNKANKGPITSAHVHGWRCPPKDIKKGAELREEIAKLKEAI